MTTPRLTAEHRRAQIVAAVKALSADGGLYDWTLTDIAEHVGISTPAVRYYFYSAQDMRRELICTAIRECDVSIVVQALAKYDPLVEDIPNELRDACAEYLRA